MGDSRVKFYIQYHLSVVQYLVFSLIEASEKWKYLVFLIRLRQFCF